MRLCDKVQARLRRWTYKSILDREVCRVVARNGGKRPALTILLDTSLRRNAVNIFTNEFKGEWSTFGPNSIWVGRLERKRKPLRTTDNFLSRELSYVPVLGALAQKGILHLFTSPELDWEFMRQRRGRPPQLGIDFFSGVGFDRVPGPIERSVVIWPAGNIDTSGKEAQLAFFRSIKDPIFKQLMSIFPSDDQIADAFHLWTAERGGLDGFLTMDQKFVNQYRTVFLKREPKFRAQVYLPSELCLKLGARPVDVDRLGRLTDPWKVGW